MGIAQSALHTQLGVADLESLFGTREAITWRH
jgi:hypothetical protein